MHWWPSSTKLTGFGYLKAEIKQILLLFYQHPVHLTYPHRLLLLKRGHSQAASGCNQSRTYRTTYPPICLPLAHGRSPSRWPLTKLDWFSHQVLCVMPGKWKQCLLYDISFTDSFQCQECLIRVLTVRLCKSLRGNSMEGRCMEKCGIPCTACFPSKCPTLPVSSWIGVCSPERLGTAISTTVLLLRVRFK